MQEKEIWNDIPLYKGYYQASSSGEIRSVDRIVPCGEGRTRGVKSKVLSCFKDSEGYLCVNISKMGNSKIARIHQLVAMAFLGHKPSGLVTVVDHVNGVKTDNRILNLEVVTHKENIRRGYKAKAIRVALDKLREGVCN